MKMPVFSRPVQAALWLTAVLTALALLKPEPSGVPAAAAPAPPEHVSPARGRAAATAEAPWVRAPEEAWTPPEAERQAALAAPAPAPSPVPPPAPIVQAPEPTAPEPAMSYLGRLEQDGRSHVFLGVGADLRIVEIGGSIDGLWKVEKVTATQVELRYLPLDQIRFIAVQ